MKSAPTQYVAERMVKAHKDKSLSLFKPSDFLKNFLVIRKTPCLVF
ncbi:hypothetical protein [uncultured Desulfobacter sp.]|nr:hypothetical protein [uncultured Desulfobacter sp.]